MFEILNATKSPDESIKLNEILALLDIRKVSDSNERIYITELLISMDRTQREWKAEHGRQNVNVKT